jgi:3-hydroxymyristoyl/3-hydroxydecanoyl-(acyl carrier protein) dehydratase
MKFRLVDKILDWSPYGRISGIKAVSFEEYCLKEPFGDEARLPETLLLESFLQLGNWLILLSSSFTRIGMVIRISEVHFENYLLPGQSLRLDVKMARKRKDGFELSGEGRVSGRSIIRGLGCLAVPVPAVDYVDPDHMRVLFSEIFMGTSIAPSASPKIREDFGRNTSGPRL